MSQAYTSFEFIQSKEIKTLQLTAHQFKHKKTGAEHIHLECDNDENVFMVAFRTIPEDSTGVAHILEHTSLCGSKRFPVRDPFFMMIRRSLNTFMNAFTSSDWTAYPFASQNKKDFFNLLSVYLDAAFFPNLHELDFAQEGHRVEFSDPKDKNSELVYKGVVYNEMKGSMSAPTSQLWHHLTHHLYPSTTYHYNSGGNPEDITKLRYEDLVEFHKTHYHPSNAIFLTFGNIPVVDLQEEFEKHALHEFEKQDKTFKVNFEQRLSAPLQVQESYPVDDDDLKDKTHIVLGWLLGESIDRKSLLDAHFLSGVLLDNSASPLQAALEKTDLAKAPSPLCGLEDSNHEMAFLCGVDASNPDHADAVEKLILDTLETVATDGVDIAMQEAVLHQLEFEQREIGGASYPFGLQLILQTLSSCIHRGTPLDVLDIDADLERLRQAIKDPNYIKKLVRTLLLENPHRVRLTLKPDNSLSKKKIADEKEQLANIKKKLSDDDATHIIEQAEALETRQKQKDDPEILPKVTPKDIPAYKPLLKGTLSQEGKLSCHYYDRGTNGIVYQSFITRLPELSKAELSALPLYVGLLDELGAGQDDYLALQRLQSQYTGSIGASSILHAHIDDEQKIYADFVVNGKALERNHAKLTELMLRIGFDTRLDETQRILEFIEQIKTSSERRITQNGHSLAMLAASSKMSPVAWNAHQKSGLKGILTTREWSKIFNDAPKNNAVLDAFHSIKEKLTHQNYEALIIGEAAARANFLENLKGSEQRLCSDQVASPFTLPSLRETVKEAWTTTTQVHFCAKAYPTVASTHPDAAKLTVLGSFLRNGFLHTAIREQGGAYGGGASHDSEIAAFRFYSYRDPRSLETFQDFDRALPWLLEEKHTQESLDEAILSVIASMDKPSSPAGEAKKAFYQNRYGREDTHRKAYREGIINTTLDDLKRVGETYLAPEKASFAIVTNVDELDKLKSLDLEHHSL